MRVKVASGTGAMLILVAVLAVWPIEVSGSSCGSSWSAAFQSLPESVGGAIGDADDAQLLDAEHEHAAECRDTARTRLAMAGVSALAVVVVGVVVAWAAIRSAA